MTTNTENATDTSLPRFDGLRALFINATLKRSPEVSNTEGLIHLSSQIMRSHGVEVDELRAVDLDLGGLDTDCHDVAAQWRSNPAEWRKEFALIEEWFEFVGDRLPTGVKDEFEALKQRLSESS